MKAKKKIIVAATAAALLCGLAGANDGGMQQLFDDMGAYGNITGPGAYHAQGMNVITGGNLFLRVPQRTYHPFSITPPRLKAGCGGIDLYGGSFSFIGRSELVSMLRNIGSRAVAYGFMLALDSISPQINKTLTTLQQDAQALNAVNINSCEAGEAIARGAKGDWQQTEKYFAQVAGPITSLFDDQSAARAATQGDEAQVDDVINHITDPDLKAQVRPGNIAWRALSKLPGLDVQDKQILMSLSGTTILPDTNFSSTPPQYIQPKAITIRQFIYGNENGKIPVYTCTDSTDPDKCMVLGDGDLSITPYTRKVEQKLSAIADKFRNNTSLTNDEINFINVTGIPVYKALAVTTAAPQAGLDTIWIGKYADLIAAEYAYEYIIQATHQIKQAFTQSSVNAPQLVQNDMEKMSDNLERLRSQSRDEVHAAYAKVQAFNQIADEIAYYERSLLANLPANLSGNLRFASAAR